MTTGIDIWKYSSSFDGFGLDFDFKAGVALFRGFGPVTLIPFVDIAIENGLI